MAEIDRYFIFVSIGITIVSLIFIIGIDSQIPETTKSPETIIQQRAGDDDYSREPPTPAKTGSVSISFDKNSYRIDETYIITVVDGEKILMFHLDEQFPFQHVI